MKKDQSTKVQKDKKDQEKQEGKEKQKEKENKKVQESDSEEDYYTEEEMKLLDKFHKMSENHFIDDEIYDLMIKFNNDEELIKNELKEMLKQLKRDKEYAAWTEIGKSN